MPYLTILILFSFLSIDTFCLKYFGNMTSNMDSKIGTGIEFPACLYKDFHESGCQVSDSIQPLTVFYIPVHQQTLHYMT